jgi:hypothetical protein
MAKTKGMTARMEDWIAGILAAMTDADGEPVFRTAKAWMHQVSATKGGAEAFARYQPFAFVAHWPSDPAREGGFGLRQILRFSVLIGVVSKSKGVARRGNNNNLGASRIRDLVIDALDGQHPGDGFGCDQLFYVSETEMVDSAKQYATELHFQANWLS